MLCLHAGQGFTAASITGYQPSYHCNLASYFLQSAHNMGPSKAYVVYTEDFETHNSTCLQLLIVTIMQQCITTPTNQGFLQGCVTSKKLLCFYPQHQHSLKDTIRWTNYAALWVQEGCALFAEQLQHQHHCNSQLQDLFRYSTSFCAHMTLNIALDTVHPYCRWGLHDLILPKAGLRCCYCFNFAQYGSEWHE